ncbi:MAG: CheR family methyltransferase [Bacteroidota bacterium]|nr:CheR family methyltransferase [Bacteroidota bacterium]
MNNQLEKIFNAELSDTEFNRLSKFIYNEVGIKLPPVKKIMLQSRLQKRLRVLEFDSYKKYIEYVFSEEGLQNEIIHMLDVVSTNKTDFFREPIHFDFLTTDVLPTFIKENNLPEKIKIWSAGCSSGEEPYTIAIVLNEFKENNPKFDFDILGTDISSRILKTAVNAIYKIERIQNIPLSTKKKYFLRSKNKENATVRIKKELRQKVHYSRLNFMNDNYSVNNDLDIIFCRNVLIYFNRDVQEKVITKLCKKLKYGGYLFIGHSESILNMNLPLKQIKPTIFQKIN